MERNLLQAEMNLASARQNELLALISLSKALGGGWDETCGFGPFEARIQEEKARWDQQKSAGRTAAEQMAQMSHAKMVFAFSPPLQHGGFLCLLFCSGAVV